MVAPKSVLVTGANRGIGLGLVKSLLLNKEIEHIIATARVPEKAEELQKLKSDSRLHILPLDIDNDDSINALVTQVEKIVGDNGLNVLINNAGIHIRLFSDEKPNRSGLTQQIVTNAVSQVILTQTFLPLLKKAASHGSGDELSWNRAAIINMSSGVASIADNKMGSGTHGSLGYRMSKAALNSFNKNFGVDLLKDHILTAAFCPGWVKTDMGGQNAELTVANGDLVPIKDLFQPEESANDMIATFAKLQTEHTGGYFRRNGDVFPY